MGYEGKGNVELSSVKYVLVKINQIIAGMSEAWIVNVPKVTQCGCIQLNFEHKY